MLKARIGKYRTRDTAIGPLGPCWALILGVKARFWVEAARTATLSKPRIVKPQQKVVYIFLNSFVQVQWNLTIKTTYGISLNGLDIEVVSILNHEFSKTNKMVG